MAQHVRAAPLEMPAALAASSTMRDSRRVEIGLVRPWPENSQPSGRPPTGPEQQQPRSGMSSATMALSPERPVRINRDLRPSLAPDHRHYCAPPSPPGGHAGGLCFPLRNLALKGVQHAVARRQGVDLIIYRFWQLAQQPAYDLFNALNLPTLWQLPQLSPGGTNRGHRGDTPALAAYSLSMVPGNSLPDKG